MPKINDLVDVPDLAVVTAPASEVPGIVAAAGARGIAAAVVITSGPGHGAGSLAEEARCQARSHGLRLVGPNCLGVLAPKANLNASFAARAAPPGDLALISQSGAIAAGLVEWAARRSVGFSGVISLGDQIDVDLADLPRLLRPRQRHPCNLVYIEAIRTPASSCRRRGRCARQAGGGDQVGPACPGSSAAATHTGALAGSDAVYDAAFRRAGLLRVFDLDEMFAAAETLGRKIRLRASGWPS